MGKLRGYAQRYLKIKQLKTRIAALESSYATCDYPVPGNAIKQLEAKVDALQTSGAEPDYRRPNSFPLQPWWQRSYWEPTVSLAVSDHCRPGDVVFDVGANAGGIALQMSRRVGPRGIVCAFEASPRIIDKTQYNLVQAGCFNTTLYHAAVYHTSGESITIYAGGHLNDSIYATGTGESFSVPTLALDDFVEKFSLVPAFIKMDIEGAELDALKGMNRLLSTASPVLVLEQSPSDLRCHELLLQLGYRAVDLATYQEIRSAADFPEGSSVANVLFLHGTRAEGSPYFSGRKAELAARLDESAFARAPDGSLRLIEPLSLPPGRYLVYADFQGGSSDNEVFAGIDIDGETVFRYHTNTQFMAASYRHWPIVLDRAKRIQPFLSFLRGADPGLVWRGVVVWHLPAFDGAASSVVT